MGEATTRRGNSDLVTGSKLVTGPNSLCPNPSCPQPQNPEKANFCQTCGTPVVVGNRYRLKSLLGQGGFGRTFLAEVLASTKSSQLCVVKQIYDASVAGKESFRSEAERLRQLGKHPQIPRLLNFIESSDEDSLGQFLVQEYAAGQTLQQRVEQQGPMAEDKVRSLLKSLTDVLQYVHSFQIIHRDIKPANIVAKAKQHSLPILVDFGAAKWVRHSPAETVIGSAGYAAPEQSMGQATFASDIYSLGLTCLHLLTGMHPFALYSAGEDKWVWQDYLTEPLAPDFAEVLERMVTRSLQQRYENASQVASALQSSQGSLSAPILDAPKQILSKAKASMPGLIERLKTERLKKEGALQWFRGETPAETKTLPTAVTMPQRWVRLHRLAPDMGLTQAMAVSPDGCTLATGGSDSAVRLWQLPSGQLLHTFAKRRFVGNGHTAPVTAVQFHPDGRALYSASADGTLKEWDSAQRCLLNTLPTAGWTPTALTIAPDSRQLVSAGSAGQIVIWDIATLLPVSRLVQHQMRVNEIALSPNNQYLVSASNDGTVKLWQREGDSFRLAKVVGKQAKPVISLALHADADGYQLVLAKTDAVEVYRLNADLSLSEPTKLYQSPYEVRQVAVSMEGCVAIATEDRLLTLWNLTTGDCVAKLSHEWGVERVVFSPDGQLLMSASADEVISIWQYRPNELAT